jgi:hypothetical protein
VRGDEKQSPTSRAPSSLHHHPSVFKVFFHPRLFETNLRVDAGSARASLGGSRETGGSHRRARARARSRRAGGWTSRSNAALRGSGHQRRCHRGRALGRETVCPMPQRGGVLKKTLKNGGSKNPLKKTVACGGGQLFIRQNWRERIQNIFCKFCATRVDPWYLYEASLKIVGFVLLHEIPKEKTGRLCEGCFENFRLIDSRTPSRSDVTVYTRCPPTNRHPPKKGSKTAASLPSCTRRCFGQLHGVASWFIDRYRI